MSNARRLAPAQTNGECKMTNHNGAVHAHVRSVLGKLASRTTLKMYRVIVSFDVEAIDAESATRQAMEIVHDNSMTIEVVREESRT
jgi:hypothetical protein